MGTLLHHLNATVTVKMSDTYGVADGLNKSHGPIQDVVSNDVDFLMNVFFLRYFWKHRSYPFQADTIKIVSRKELATFADKFSLIFNIKVWIFLIAYCSLSVVALQFILKQPMSTAVLEFVRIFVGAPNVGQPQNSFSKIFLFTFVIAVFTISTFVQSLLSAISTAPFRKATIDSVEDLIESNLTVYGHPNYKNLIANDIVRKNYHALDRVSECLNLLTKNDHMVCINVQSELKYYIQESQKMHISTNHMFERGYTFMYAEDLPFSHKFDWILSKLNEAGIPGLAFGREEHHYVHNGTDVLDIADSEEALIGFYVLLGGWALAILSFSIEFFMPEIKKCGVQLRKLNKSKVKYFFKIVAKSAWRRICRAMKK